LASRDEGCAASAIRNYLITRFLRVRDLFGASCERSPDTLGVGNNADVRNINIESNVGNRVTRFVDGSVLFGENHLVIVFWCHEAVDLDLAWLDAPQSKAPALLAARLAESNEAIPEPGPDKFPQVCKG
jgi:hypothetical protein